MPTENETRTFSFADSDGEYKVEIWCEGRIYDALYEAYRPVYSYKITHPKWEYTDNDIHGAVNEVPNLDAAARSLFAFLYACQEGLPEDTDAQGENARLFPPHVREWAYQVNTELESVYTQIVNGGNGSDTFT